MKTNYIILGVLGVLVGLLAVMFVRQENVQAPTSTDDVVMRGDQDTTTMPAISVDRGETNDTSSTPYSGEQINSGTTPYLVFNAEDYEKALSEDKVIYLEFYADWCPTCKAQEPRIVDGMDQLNRSDLVGFRVNYKDSSTDAYEQDLAEAFDVTYQHTKVLIDSNGDTVYNSSEIWRADDVVEQLSSVQ